MPQMAPSEPLYSLTLPFQAALILRNMPSKSWTRVSVIGTEPSGSRKPAVVRSTLEPAIFGVSAMLALSRALITEVMPFNSSSIFAPIAGSTAGLLVKYVLPLGLVWSAIYATTAIDIVAEETVALR